MPSKPSAHLDLTKIAKATLQRRTIAPPPDARLTDAERKQFDNLASEFTVTEISDHKLQLMVPAARMLAAVHEEQALLTKEGTTLPTPNGRTMVNPRINNINGWLNTILKLRRALGIGNARRSLAYEAEHRATVKQQEAGIRSVLDDDMIAKPGYARPGPKRKHDA